MSQAGANGHVNRKDALRTETLEDSEMFEKLFRLVLRSFYDDKFVVIAEQVFRWTMLPADVLAGRLGIATKDIAALGNKLVEDKVICHFKRSEKKEGVESRMFPRSYYYIHPPLFLAMLKYRLHHLRLKLDSSITSSTYTTSFICPQCRFTYSTLDVAHLLDFSTNTLRCERPGCGEELKEDEEEGEETRRGKARMRKFNEQCATIIRGLEVLEGVKMPFIDPVEFLASPANHKWKSLRADKESSHPSPYDFKDMSSIPDAKAGPMSESAAPTISLTDATTSAAALKAAREEADRQRKENAIPEWLRKSTVSGQETALGIKDRAAREIHEQRTGGPSHEGENGTGDDAEDEYYAQYARLQEQEEEEQRKQIKSEDTSDSTAKRRRSEEEEQQPEDKNGHNKKVRLESEQSAPAPATEDSVDVGEVDEDEDDFEEVA